MFKNNKQRCRAESVVVESLEQGSHTCSSIPRFTTSSRCARAAESELYRKVSLSKTVIDSASCSREQSSRYCSVSFGNRKQHSRRSEALRLAPNRIRTLQEKTGAFLCSDRASLCCHIPIGGLVSLNRTDVHNFSEFHIYIIFHNFR